MILNVSIIISYLIVFLFSGAAFSGETNIGQGRVYDIGTYVTDLQRTKAFYTRVFGLKVVREWETTDVSVDDKTYKTVKNPGFYLAGSNGMRLEFLLKGDPKQSSPSIISQYTSRMYRPLLIRQLQWGRSRFFPARRCSMLVLVS